MNPDLLEANWLCTHGTYDNVLPFETSKEQVQVLQDGGFNVEFKAYGKDHSIDREELEYIGSLVKSFINN